ncbi:ribosome small subunit-dependent GTPase A [Xylophilus sp. GOD-11R]|uniref:ribosome small subunit-dependent GTPase A n=1 Tax=Xylophilus sp. GOD-11R TaxID=3089814 RepID=UPI00298C4683|nr:ribosome small subunit-dependent GTPase A [Xylophilus sp. GOD-11R]WPB55667.1 ribosome small subunit-dependent GTPase A [Xylophilus sp. GOD-11R]
MTTRLQQAADVDEGLVVAAHGRHCVVESPDGERRICTPRGKKSQAVVGDRVLWQAPTPGQGDTGTVEKVVERRNLFYRQDELRTKSFAANLDQILMLVAAEPEFSAMQLSRALIAAEAARIVAIVGINKSDLVEPFDKAWERLLPYRRMKYGVLPLSLTASPDADHEELTKLLRGKTTLVLGPSGAGKSTLINLMVPGASAQTGEISQALNSGKHTTTSTSFYWVPDADAPPRSTGLIDSPGFQEFGLYHLEPPQLAACMPDIAAHATECRFYNCSHLHEPGCGVRAALEQGEIDAHRYKIYTELHAELSEPKRY